MSNVELKDLNTLNFNRDGLIPAIIQSSTTKEVLMMAWMNFESLTKSLTLGETVFWSRSRSELWHKGESSGNTQRIASIAVDCDRDTLLILVEEAGPACHTGSTTCFDNHDIAERNAQ